MTTTYRYTTDKYGDDPFEGTFDEISECITDTFGDRGLHVATHRELIDGKWGDSYEAIKDADGDVVAISVNDL